MIKYKFQSYHPYLTYSGDTKYFIQPDGRPAFSVWRGSSNPELMSDDAIELWQLGKNAFDALPKFDDIQKFNEYYKTHLDIIEHLNKDLQEIAREKKFVFTNQDGEIASPDFDEMGSSDIVDLYWQIALGTKTTNQMGFLAHHFLFICLEHIDNAVIAICLDGGGIYSVISAVNAYANYQAIESGDNHLQKARSDLAMRGALERYKRDPKQVAKRLVKECWEEWKISPTRYNTQYAFATDVLTKVEVNKNGEPIISFDTIVKKWIPEWTKEKK